MKSTVRLILPVMIVVGLAPSLLGQSSRGPSTAEERATAVKAAHLLESDPFNKDAKKLREWFTLWLIQIPDITVQACTAYLGPVVGSKYKYDSELFSQTMFSGVAFIVENPEQAKDPLNVNVAGLEGALKAYEAIVKEKPKARHEFLDELVAKRDKGELRGYVEEVAKTKCKGGS